MATLQTPPPGEEPSLETREIEASAPLRAGGRSVLRGRAGARYDELQQHELITLLDEIDDERARARFREAVYISVIVWLIIGFVLVYGPRYLWHAPVLIARPEDKRLDQMTYLDVPPDLKKQLQRTKPAPAISTQSTESQSPKPSPRAPEPKAGEPARPAPPVREQPRPQPQPQQPAPPQQQQQQPPPQQQQARNTPPTPVPPTPRPQQPVADAPTPNKNIFNNQPQSAQQAIQQAARDARSGNSSGDYGVTGRGIQGGQRAGVQVLSDTQGVDFAKYLQRLLADVRRGWLPLIPEECRPPLNKKGITGVRFSIQPDGKIGAMHLDYSTHDVAIDRAAWGSITTLGYAQPLPKEFHGPNLELRIEFRINQDGDAVQ